MNTNQSDFYSDQGAFFVKAFHDTKMPDFVKNAEPTPSESLATLPYSSFADEATRSFPMHTPADVYISATYLFGKSASIDLVVAQKLKQAAVMFDMADAYNEARSIGLAYSNGVLEKSADVDCYDWEIECNNFSARGSDQASLVRASDHFLAKVAQYSFDDREEIAAEFLLASRALGVDVSPDLKKYAAEGYFNATAFANALEQRALIVKGNEKLAMLDDIKAVANMDDPSELELRKAANFLNTFDNQYGVNRHYGNGVIDPHSAVWSSPEPIVIEQPAIVKIGNCEYPLEKVAGKLPEAFNFATGKIMDLLENGKLDLGLLGSLSNTESDVINSLVR